MKHKTFQNAGFTYNTIVQDLKRVLQTFGIEPVVANDLDVYLAQSYNQVVFNTFWTSRTHTDNHYLDEKLDIFRKK